MFRDFLRIAGGRCSHVLENEPRLLWMLASKRVTNWALRSVTSAGTSLVLEGLPLRTLEFTDPRPNSAETYVVTVLSRHCQFQTHIPSEPLSCPFQNCGEPSNRGSQFNSVMPQMMVDELVQSRDSWASPAQVHSSWGKDTRKFRSTLGVKNGASLALWVLAMATIQQIVTISNYRHSDYESIKVPSIYTCHLKCQRQWL